jgi:uncharacterized coiled-coil protein SlyX
MSDRTKINQANAQHSTGPKTEAGKQKSSLNALRHGLTSEVVVLPTESLEAYQLHLRSFHDEYHPVGPTETNMVRVLADTFWRLHRIETLEARLLCSDASIESLAKTLGSLSMHSQRLSRQFERIVNQLRELQQTRRQAENRELDRLLDITQMYEDRGEPYDPSEDGFDFSEDRINERILARNRDNLADEALVYLDEAA